MDKPMKGTKFSLFVDVIFKSTKTKKAINAEDFSEAQ